VAGHGAGSACGKALGAVPSSTVGYEKRANWGVATTDESEFVRMVLEGQPEPPRYFAEMKRINRDGARVLGGISTPARQPADALPALVRDRAWLVDMRAATDFARGHVPGAALDSVQSQLLHLGRLAAAVHADIWLLTDAEGPDTPSDGAGCGARSGADRPRPRGRLVRCLRARRVAGRAAPSGGMYRSSRRWSWPNGACANRCR
jgi:hypothetical protein